MSLAQGRVLKSVHASSQAGAGRPKSGSRVPQIPGGEKQAMWLTRGTRGKMQRFAERIPSSFVGEHKGN